ncbi:hypothetical protein TEA_017628 [Camellia sinensis var. sinensis]|uniref:RING-type E3 ubiquitin transferase n=1 Tax=Camellia sinensis var. sinensis TaxID=542762 RepID=A0A4S4CWA5_CAMSN|nr:hypothetical protein TEA_017628 [Camellia sinensis var. sinensis]
MAPGGSVYQDVLESRTAFADYGIAPTEMEFRNSTFRKSASVGGGKVGGMASNSAVHELLECPVCLNLMYPPIHQTKRYLKKTQANLNEGRKERRQTGIAMRYQFLGCQDIFPYHSRLRHEQNCRFRPYNCPYAGAECNANGDIQFLVAHLKDDHKVFNCFGHQFCLHFEAFNIGMAPVYMAFLRFMGDDHEAKKFSYSLEVGGNGRKLTWQGVPRSIRDTHKTVRDSLDGLIIQRNLALFFSGGDGQELKLKVAGRIWKEQL